VVAVVLLTLATVQKEKNAVQNALVGNNAIMDISIIGKQIIKGRKAKNLSQLQFAELLNVTPQAVGKWERSESLPDIFTLGKIGEIIGTSDICYFLGKPPCTCTCGCCECCQSNN